MAFLILRNRKILFAPSQYSVRSIEFVPYYLVSSDLAHHLHRKKVGQNIKGPKWQILHGSYMGPRFPRMSISAQLHKKLSPFIRSFSPQAQIARISSAVWKLSVSPAEEASARASAARSRFNLDRFSAESLMQSEYEVTFSGGHMPAGLWGI